MYLPAKKISESCVSFSINCWIKPYLAQLQYYNVRNVRLQYLCIITYGHCLGTFMCKVKVENNNGLYIICKVSFFCSTVADEVRHQVLRLQHHASIALWAGNNENEAALRGNW